MGSGDRAESVCSRTLHAARFLNAKGVASRIARRLGEYEARCKWGKSSRDLDATPSELWDFARIVTQGRREYAPTLGFAMQRRWRWTNAPLAFLRVRSALLSGTGGASGTRTANKLPMGIFLTCGCAVPMRAGWKPALRVAARACRWDHRSDGSESRPTRCATLPWLSGACP